MIIKAIVFDLDDMLFSQKDYVFSGLKELDHMIRKRYSIENFYEAAVEEYEKGERELLINRTLEKLNIKYDMKLVHSLIKAYRSHNPNIELLQEAKLLIENIVGGVKLGIISDGDLDQQFNKIKALGLLGRFHSIILSDRFGRENWKPSDIPYIHLTMALEVEHRECVYIGHNVTKDFVTAKKLGWLTVQVKRPLNDYTDLDVSEEYKADYQVNNLRELSTIPKLQHLFTHLFVSSL